MLSTAHRDGDIHVEAVIGVKERSSSSEWFGVNTRT